MRFPGFDSEWELIKLKDFANINPKSSELPSTFNYVDLESVVDGQLVKRNEISKLDAPSRAQRVLQKNDVIFQMVRPYQKNNYYFDKEGFYVASTGYAQLRTDQDSMFLYQFLHNQNFVDKVIEKCTGTSYPAINSNDLGKIKFYYPTLNEQKSIGNFLKLIDFKIVTQKKTITHLETLIKTYIDQIFEQKLSFNPNHENWQMFKLEELGNTFNGLTGKTKEDFGSGKKFIQYKQIFDSPQIKMDDCGYVQINENENQQEVKYGDSFFTISSETPHEIGMSSVLLDEVQDTFLNSFCFGFRFNSFAVLNPVFASFLFRSSLFRNQITKLAQGSTRYNMSKSEFLKISVEIPNEQEQTKIAGFLSKISNKIETEKRILELFEQQKKYLLQNLFV